MSDTPRGSLIIIGGHEAKTGEQAILREVATRAGKSGRLVVITAASQEPDDLAATYKEAFGELGVKHVELLDIRTREQARTRLP
jgi:cyanophycinase